MSAESELIEQRLRQAVGEIVRDVEGGVVTKFVMVIETFDSEGELGAWTLCSDGITIWDVLGLLDFALVRQRHQIERPT